MPDETPSRPALRPRRRLQQSFPIGGIGVGLGAKRHPIARDCRDCRLPLRDDAEECPRCGTIPYQRGLGRA